MQVFWDWREIGLGIVYGRSKYVWWVTLYLGPLAFYVEGEM